MMGEFAEMGDWDLQAIVRGYCTGTHEFSSPTDLMDMKDDPPLMGFAATYTPPSTHYHFTTAFPDDLFETATVLDELQQLYKPFYPISPHERPPSSPSLHISGDLERETVVIDHHDQEGNKQPLATPTPNPNPTSTSPTSAATTSTAAPTKYKRRKNQQKRVVLNVTADGLSSDMWAWRKYGQKPIKGSPYPRSYYRCSSTKGCLARKQVERSNSDPTMFIVTYTAEHSHSQPTRRNSLAGTTRNKFSSCKSKTSPAATTTVGHYSDTLTPKHSTTSSSSSSVSAAADHPSPITTPLSETTHHQPIKDYHEDEEPQLLDPFMDMDMGMGMDMGMISDDFFAGLEELDEMVSACPNRFPMAFSC